MITRLIRSTKKGQQANNDDEKSVLLIASLQQVIQHDGNNVEVMPRQVQHQQETQKKVPDVVLEMLIMVFKIGGEKRCFCHIALLDSEGSNIMITYSALPKGITLYTCQNTRFSTTTGTLMSNCMAQIEKLQLPKFSSTIYF